VTISLAGKKPAYDAFLGSSACSSAGIHPQDLLDGAVFVDLAPAIRREALLRRGAAIFKFFSLTWPSFLSPAWPRKLPNTSAFRDGQVGEERGESGGGVGSVPRANLLKLKTHHQGIAAGASTWFFFTTGI